MILSRDDLQLEVDNGSYQRGVTYFHQNKTELLEVKSTKNQKKTYIRAKTQGSGRQEYLQSIDIIYDNNANLDLRGRCTCPVRYNCKHVVSACLLYINKQHQTTTKSKDTSDCLNWLDEFVSVSNDNSETENGPEFICYVLTQGEDTGILNCSLYVSRHLKRGGLGKPRPTQLHNLLSKFTRPQFANQQDSDIAQILNSIEGRHWSSYPLTGELGHLAINKMLETSRCFWKDINSPLIKLGERRDLELSWQKQEKNAMKLSINVLPDAEIIQTSPALYFDTHNLLMGPLKGASFTPAQWKLLSHIPAIPKENVEEFSKKLMLNLPGIHLPPPIELDSEEVKDKPIAHLNLVTVNPNKDSEFHILKLRFNYSAYQLPAQAKGVRHTLALANKIVYVHRDLPLEEKLKQRLLDEGFETKYSLDDDDLGFAPITNDNPIQVANFWQHFIDAIVPTLEVEGWKIKIDDNFNYQFLDVDDWQIDINSANEWFDLRFDLEVGKHKIPLLPLISDVLANYDLDNLPAILTVPIDNKTFINLPSVRIEPICRILYELHDSNSISQQGALKLSRFDAARINELEVDLGKNVNWHGGEALRKLGRKLKDFTGIKNVAIPKSLNAELRDYQQQGLNWLQFLREYELGGILADDMGLGKTVQTLACLLIEKEKKRMDKPCLIIAPTSLMSNWRREAEKFTHKLKVLVLQGSERQELFHEIPNHDLILSTYPLLTRDYEVLNQHKYHYLVLDEAQNIKNSNTKASKLVRQINAKHRLCLTGTPMENHLGELWAQFDFLMPGFLGNNQFFKRQFRTPIERHGNFEKQQRLNQRVQPFMLRRTKSEVITELPPKTEIIRSIVLQTKQSALYESIRLSMERKVRQAIAQKGLARSHIMVLDALLKLRQTCCDPALLSIPEAKKVQQSAKLEMLMEMLPELIEEGRRVLLFSQFTKMLAIIEDRLNAINIKYTKLTGQTRKRDEAIECFKRGEADVFLISLKAGGVGLNLTEADTVIHYDPWWNPAAENQATDRAHRIGQDKPVFVYKLITENTVEEKILSLQEKKLALINGVYQKDQKKLESKLTAEDLDVLFSPLHEL